MGQQKSMGSMVSQRVAGAIAAGTAVFWGIALVSPAAQAQAAYGSYIGVGASLGLTSDRVNPGQQIGGVINVRYKMLEWPLSLRTQAFVGSGTAVVPTLSYDLPLSWQTDVYLGAGMSFASGTTPSPVGDKTSFAVQPGIDYVVPNANTVLFGNAVIAFDAYRNGGGSAVAIQGGVGLRF